MTDTVLALSATMTRELGDWNGEDRRSSKLKAESSKEERIKMGMEQLA